MKIKLNVNVGKEITTLRITVGAADTASKIKERVADIQPIPFVNQDLVYNGEVIKEGTKLCDCGVKDGSHLDLNVNASESDLVKQLAELLEAKHLSCDELELLYCYKYGASLQQALQMIGAEEKLPDFIGRQKSFVLASGLVSLASGCAPLDLSKVAEKKDTPTVTREAASVGSCIVTPSENQKYQDLHDKVSGRQFYQKALQMLNLIVDVIMEASFLNVDHVVKGGSIGKGTAISDASDAEVVCFVSGLPATADHEKWLPALLRAVTAILSTRFLDNHSTEIPVERVETTADSVRLSLKERSFVVDVRFSPIFESYAGTIQLMGEQRPELRCFLLPSLVKERVQFIARQPAQVKVTIRLLRWWRAQQHWSSEFTRPADEVLELIAVYSAAQMKHVDVDLRTAIEDVMSLLARFDELSIAWSSYYAKEDVSATLLCQLPLVMDPVNPFVNVADARYFDASELMLFAKTPHFFQ